MTALSNRNKIYAIVEGHGEAGANQVLAGRILQELNCWTLYPGDPFRLSYGRFFRDDILEKAIRLHKKFADCAALLILLDMDDDCPKEKASELVERIKKMEALPFSVAVVCAKREYEAWFLASLTAIHPGQEYEGDPEEKRDAKGWLRRNFDYKPTQDQAKYTQRLDLALARSRSRSFRRLCHALAEITAAHQTGAIVITPEISG